MACSGRKWKKGEESGRKEKKIIKKYFIISILAQIRLALNGAQKLQKIENIIPRRNMKTV